MEVMNLRAFGTLSLDDGPREIEIGPLKHRLLLGALLVDANRVVSAETLAERIWGDAPKTSIHPIVSRLRARLAPVDAELRLRTQSPGYVLEFDPALFDVARYELGLRRARGAADQGDVEQALGLLTGAEREWRGEPYAELSADFARREALRLAELRDAALDLRIDLELQIGRHQQLADTLPELIRNAPLRESLRHHHMLALYRAGRQAEALLAYAEAREFLGEELGVEPGPELQDLHVRILNQDPALTVTAPATRALEVVAPSATASPAPAPASVEHGLIGRDDDLARLLDELRTQRLVTLHGPGGVGKTSLAQAVPPADAWADGISFVDLVDVRDPALLVEGIASAVGLTGVNALDGLVRAIGSRHQLLILDNCEHLVDGVVGVVTALLAGCPNLRILTTTRTTLSVPSEVVLDLAPLDTRADGDAIALFVRQGTRALPGWVPDEQKLEAIAELCELVDGLPLAIELAAAQLRALSVRQIADHLRRTSGAGLGSRRASGRHATIEATIGWSYGLLDEHEARVFRALSYLEGAFDLDAVIAVAGPDAIGDLVSLVNQSMVQVIGGDPRRYRVLETLRAYGAERRDAQEDTELAERLTGYVRSLAEVADVRLRSFEGREWMDRIGHAVGNIRKVLDTVDDPRIQLEILNGVYWHWYRGGNPEELCARYRRLAPAVESLTASDDEADLVLLIRGSVAMALLSYLNGQLDVVQSELGRAGALIPRVSDAVAQAYGLSTIAFFEAGGGAPEPAIGHATAALQIAEAFGSGIMIAEARMCLAMAHQQLGNAEESDVWFARSIEQADAIGYAWCGCSSRWLRVKGWINRGEDRDETFVLLGEMLQSSATESDVTSWLVGVETLAYALHRRGRVEESGVLVGIIERQSELHGFHPLTMDPVDLRRYRGEIGDELRTTDLRRGSAMGWDEATAYLDRVAAEAVAAA